MSGPIYWLLRTWFHRIIEIESPPVLLVNNHIPNPYTRVSPHDVRLIVACFIKEA